MKNTKLIIVGAIAIGIILIIIGAVVTPVFWKNSALMTEEDIAVESDNAYDKDYTAMQKIYLELDDDNEIAVDDLQDKLAKLDKAATLELQANGGTILINDTTESITFTVFREESDSPDEAKDFVYHDLVNDTDLTIHKSSEDSYQHFNGAITTEFKNKKEAINYHLMFRQ